MFTVSRTPVSETWLSPSMPVESKSLEPSRRIGMDKGRVSATSINSELFPELLSWSAIIDFTQRSAALPQPIPSDFTEEEETDVSTVNERRCSIQVSLTQVFDPTTLVVGFDLSCFDGLDDRLIYDPKEAFVDWCWSECVGVPSPEIVQEVETEPCMTPTPPSPTLDTKRRSLFEWSSDESGSDTEESVTPRGSEDMDTVELGNSPHFNSPYPIADLPPYESLYWNHDMKLNGPFPCELQNLPDPSESVGYFPMPANQPKKLPRRLASLLQFGKRPVS